MGGLTPFYLVLAAISTTHRTSERQPGMYLVGQIVVKNCSYLVVIQYCRPHCNLRILGFENKHWRSYLHTLVKSKYQQNCSKSVCVVILAIIDVGNGMVMQKLAKAVL